MTEAKSSWSFVEISPDAREAAERAASAAGMDLDAWLAQLIKYTSAMELKTTPEKGPAKAPSPASTILLPALGRAPARPTAQALPVPALPVPPGPTAPVPAAPAPAAIAPAPPMLTLSIAPARPAATGDTLLTGTEHAPSPPPFSLPNPAPRPTVTMPQRPQAPAPTLALRPALSDMARGGQAATSFAMAAAGSVQVGPAPAGTALQPRTAAAVAPALAPAAAQTAPAQPAATQAVAERLPGPAPTAARPESRPDTARPDFGRPEPARPDQARPDQARPDQTRAEAARMVATDMLHPSRFAALASPKEDDIQAALDKWRASGMLEPLIVRPRGGTPGQYEIISGIDRWHAARRAYVRQIPVLVREAGDQEALELGLVDQLRRAPLSPMAEANIYLRLLNDAGLDTERAARLAGKPAAHVATMVRILNLPKPVRAMLESGEITVMHARALLDAPNPEAIARDIVEKRLDIYQTEQLVRVSSRGTDTVDVSLLVDEPTEESIVEMGTAPFAREPRPVPAAPTASLTRRAGDAGVETATPAAGTDGEPRPAPPSARRPSEARTPRETDVISTDLLERNIANTLGVRCAISERNGVGVITLHYTSREELVRILSRINGGGAVG